MMRIFCDACGNKFENGDLRPQSRYCPKCGIPLQQWVIEAMQRAQPSVRDRSTLQRTDTSQTNSLLSFVPGEPFFPQDEEEYLYGFPPDPNPGHATPPLAIHSPSRPASVESESGSETADGYSEYQESETASTNGESESIPPTTDKSPELSLDIRDHRLPPPFPVPVRYNQAFTRRIITKLLGGNPQTTYPVARDRRRPMYACPKMSNNPTLPSFAGAPGFLITKPVPKELPTENFVLFVSHIKESVWYYRGQYRVRWASHLTPRQWAQQPRKFRNERIKFITDKAWGIKEMKRLRLVANYRNAKLAIENGEIKWEVKVLECVGFDIDLYNRLCAEMGI